MLENLQQGLNNLQERCSKLQDKTIDQLLDIYMNLSVLIEKSIKQFSNEIGYPAQALQGQIADEIRSRVKC